MNSLHWTDEGYRREGGKHYASVYLLAGVGQVLVAIWFAFAVTFLPVIVDYSHEIPLWVYPLVLLAVVVFSFLGYINIAHTLNLRKSAYSVQVEGNKFEVETYASKTFRFLLCDVEAVEPFNIQSKKKSLSGLDPDKTHYRLMLKSGEQVVLPGSIPQIETLISMLESREHST